MSSKLDQLFHLSERHTDVKTEVIAGVTTFMTMAYILAVNPNILSASGMDQGAIFTATCLASMIATVLMALLSNYPFVLSAGMGLNAYFAFTVVGQMGYSWQMALAAVFVEGLIFFLLSLTHVREALFNAIPTPLKHAVSAGIGLFIAFIGMQNAKLVVNNDSTLLSVFSMKDSIKAGTFHTEGITVILTLIGVLFTAFLIVKKVKGNILIGILATWVVGILCQFTGLYVPDNVSFFSLLPDFSNGISIPSIAPTFMHMDFSKVFTMDFVVIMFAFLFVDMFDTLGTLIGVASKADMLDKDGKLPRIKGALMADAVATSVGAIFGTSTTTTFVESASGVAVGGRTGLTALVTGILFLVSTLFAPIFTAIPSFATAPALIMVGFLMVGTVTEINFDLDNLTESIPAYLAIIAMPLFYSISEGISLGVISYVLLNVAAGKGKKVAPLMYVLAVLFVLKYIFL